MLQNDGENGHDQPLALDRLCMGPRLSNEGKFAIAIKSIFPIGRSRITVLEQSPDGGHDWRWEGIKSDEG